MNKNVAYNLRFFKKHNIRYDESRTKYFGASDDCDLGMQIQQHGGGAYYDPSALVYHKDLLTFWSYTKRIISRSLAHATYENKWRAFRRTIRIPKKARSRFSSFFPGFIKENGLTVLQGVQLLALLVYTSIVVKTIKLYIRLHTYI